MAVHLPRRWFLVPGCAVVSAALLVSCGDRARQDRKADDATAAREEPPVHDAAPPPSLEGMVLVPEGEFWFGCDPDTAPPCNEADEPYRRVYLPAFYIDRTEVTVAAFAECVAAGACDEPTDSFSGRCDTEVRNWKQADRDRHPINCVTWEHAVSYCRFRNKRLPSVEEWEKAARGTDGRTYPWGNEAPTCELATAARDVSREPCDGRDSTSEVGSRPAGASPYGVLDMAGNVEEWTTIDFSARAGKHFDDIHHYRNYPLKGGMYASAAWELRMSYVSFIAPGHTRPIGVGVGQGFRCAYSEDPPPAGTETRVPDNK